MRSNAVDLLAPIEKGRRRDRESAVPRHDLEQANEAIRLRIRQRPQKHAVHDAEDRAGGADPERQREDGDDREAGRLSELPNRVTRIAQDVHRHGEPAPSRWMDSVEPIRQPLDRRPGVRAIGEPQILCHPLPVADLPGGVGVRLGVGLRRERSPRGRSLRAATRAPSRSATRARARRPGSFRCERTKASQSRIAPLHHLIDGRDVGLPVLPLLWRGRGGPRTSAGRSSAAARRLSRPSGP